jgi:hypothetical protein
MLKLKTKAAGVNIKTGYGLGTRKVRSLSILNLHISMLFSISCGVAKKLAKNHPFGSQVPN